MGSLKFLNDEALEETAVAAELESKPEEQPKEDKKESAENKPVAPKKPKNPAAKPKQSAAANSAAFLRILAEFPIAVSIITAFFLWGFLGNAFHVSWVLFLLVPLFHSLIEAVSRKNASLFAYPVLVIFVYCLLGCARGLWHPYWVLFLTIPIYYTIVSAVSKKK